MQSLILLLVSTLQLLNLVSANLGLPADFKTSAIKIAISAVQTAQDSLKDNSLASTTVMTQITSSEPTIVPIQVVTPIPVFGSTPSPSPTIAPTNLARIDISTSISYDNGMYNFSRKDTTFTKGKDNSLSIGVTIFDENSKQVKLPVIVTTNDPDIPFSFSINGQGVSGSFNLGQFQNEYKLQHGECLGSLDCTPISTGLFTFTFTQADLNLSKTLTIEIK